MAPGSGSVDDIHGLDADIVIVGGGTAGCVLAERLSEDGALKVVLIEAGRNRNDDTNIKNPGAQSALLGNDDYDWCFVTEPQAGLNGRRIAHPRGKVIGGSSAINSHALIYPSQAEFDDGWATLGNPNWQWKDIAPYFRKFQSIALPKPETSRDLDLDYLHGFNKGSQAATTGPIWASYPRSVHPLQKAWIDTFRQAGCAASADPLDGNAIGGLTTPCAIQPGKRERSHAGVAYLQRALNRANLRIIEDALVEKIIFDHTGDEPRAKAVQLKHADSSTSQISALREIILCAGAFQSPQLLELSGIGSRVILEQHGIEVIVENPNVGENLQDHIMCGPSIQVHDSIPTKDRTSDPAFAQQQREAYGRDGSGIYGEAGTYSFAHMSLAMFPSSSPSAPAAVQSPSATLPNSSTTTTPSFPHHAFLARTIASPTRATSTTYLVLKQRHMDLTPSQQRTANSPGNFLSVRAMLAHPFSRGTCHITAPTITTPPAIDPAYLTDPRDTALLAAHMLQIERILSSPPLSSSILPNGTRLPLSCPGPYTTTDQAIHMLRACASTNYHPVGTCAMMSRELGGVVDERLCVYGVKGLRVCDASVFPVVPRGNVLTTVYAVAERAVDLIREGTLV